MNGSGILEDASSSRHTLLLCSGLLVSSGDAGFSRYWQFIIPGYRCGHNTAEDAAAWTDPW
ncbi:MAG: hypothetical protein CSA32_00645 [Desulfobulbus propionicus]|nr:MAG: hypothetical protein CSA32_00645 [Desulfobulbus propionicus]